MLGLFEETYSMLTVLDSLGTNWDSSELQIFLNLGKRFWV